LEQQAFNRDVTAKALILDGWNVFKMAYIVVEIVSHFFNLDEDDTDFDSSELRELVKDKVQSVRDYRGNSLVAGSKEVQ